MRISTGVRARPEQRGTDHLVADGLLTVPEPAAFLSVSRSKLYELMDEGMLEYVKIGRSRRIPRRALVALAAANVQGGWRQ